jgi:hypothetical protein
MATTVLLENFDSFTDWTVGGTTGGARTSWTGYGYRPAAATSSTLTYAIPGGFESDTIIVGSAQSINALSVTRTVFELRSDAGVTQHITVDVTATGVLEVRRGTVSGTVLASSAAGAVTAGAWFYVEVKVKLHDTIGTVEARVNGVQVIAPTTGLDTKNAGTKTTFDAIRLIGSSNPQFTYDDVYIVTGSDAAFLGVQRVGGFDTDVIHEPFNTLTAWSNSGCTIVPAGRTGRCMSSDGVGSGVTLTIPAPAVSKMVVVGFGLYPTTLPPSAGVVDFLKFTGASSLRLSGAGALSISGNVPSANGVIQTNRWQYVEFLIMPGGSTAGRCEIRVDGVTVVGPFIDHNLEGSIGATISTVQVTGLAFGTVSGNTYIDDLYVRSGELVAFEGPQNIGPAFLSYTKWWDGDSFEMPVGVSTWDGSAFVEAVGLKTWNGSIFV